jgi:hypothetical protein
LPPSADFCQLPVISAWPGLTSASNRCANSGVSRHIRQVRSLKLIR